MWPKFPGQLAVNYVVGHAPPLEAIAAAERELEQHPDDYRYVKRVGIGYFFRYYILKDRKARPVAGQLFARALQLNPDDAESVAYQGALQATDYLQSNKADEEPARRAFELLAQAERMSPEEPAVLSTAGAFFILLHDPFQTAPHAARVMERMLALMRPRWSEMSAHGQQRILLTLGQAYSRMGRPADARPLLEEALRVDQTSVEASIIRRELKEQAG
jgi:tetratricopeptide (TPR) repeat protein